MFASLAFGRQIALVAAIVGFVMSFFAWETAGSGGYGVSYNGWHGIGVIAVVFFIVSGAVAVLPLLGMSLRLLIPGLPANVPDALLLFIAGVVATLSVLAVLTEAIATSGVSAGTAGWIALVAGLAIIAGSYLLNSETGAI